MNKLSIYDLFIITHMSCEDENMFADDTLYTSEKEANKICAKCQAQIPTWETVKLRVMRLNDYINEIRESSYDEGVKSGN